MLLVGRSGLSFQTLLGCDPLLVGLSTSVQIERKQNIKIREETDNGIDIKSEAMRMDKKRR